MECSIVVELPLYWMLSEKIIALHLMEVGLKKNLNSYNSIVLLLVSDKYIWDSTKT